MYIWQVSSKEHIADRKMQVKNILVIIACITQARNTVDLLYRLNKKQIRRIILLN